VKKAVRITAWILALILLLQVAVMVLLQSPRIQTYLGRKAIDFLQDKMDADITFGSASIRPFDAIVLEDILVMDRAPMVADMDTLLYVKHLSARFSLMGLLQGGGIYVNRAQLDGGCFHLVTEPNPNNPDKSATNLQRIFRLKDSGSTPHWGDLLRARSLEVNGVHFRLENIPGAELYAQKGIVMGEGVIDWNHLDVVLEHVGVKGVRMLDDLISCTAEHLSVRELKTGLTLEDLGARVRVGKANVHLEDFQGQLNGGDTRLVVSRLDLDGKLDVYEDFINQVRMDITLRDGTYVDMSTVSHFGPNLDQMGFRGRIKGRMVGTVSNFSLQDMAIDGLSEDVSIRADGRISGLPEIEQTLFDFQIDDFTFGMGALADFIREWAPDVDLASFKRMAPGEDFTLTGHLDGLLNDLNFTGHINSRLGMARADVYMDNTIDMKKPITIGGQLETEDLHLGRLLGTKDLGDLSLTTTLEGVFSRKGGTPQLQLDTLHIQELGALGYTYSGISASGYYQGTDFDVLLRSIDPNLQLDARAQYHETPERDGHMDVDARLAHADLQQLNLDKRGISLVEGLQLTGRIIRQEAHATGSIAATGLSLINDTGRHPIGNIKLQIDAVDTLHRLDLTSGMLDARFTGSRSVTSLVQDLKSLALGNELSALSPEKLPEYSGAAYSASARVKDLRNLLAFVAPGLYVENGTQLTLDVTPDGQMEADVTSGRVALRSDFIRDMKLHLNNGKDALSGEITGSTIAISGARLNNNRLSFHADDNQLGLGYVFDNEADNEDNDETRAELNLTGGLARGEKGLEVTARALPSQIYYHGNGWSLSSGDIFYTGNRVKVDSLLARHDDQRLLVDGGFSREKADTLSIAMDQFDIALANTILGESIPVIEGRATGRAMLLSSSAETPGLLAGIVCDSTSIGGKRVGQLRLNSVWDEVYNRFVGNLSTLLDGRSTLEADAYLVPATKEMQLEMQLNRFDLGYAEYFLQSVFHEFYGNLSGKLSLGGRLGDLHVNSRDLRLENGRLALDFTRVPYDVNGKLVLNDKGLHFSQVSVTDGEDGEGEVSGSMLFNIKDLNDIRMDTHVTLRNMHALALERGVNPLAYGSVYASGKVDITGPLNKLNVYVEAASTKEGEFHLPLGSSTSGSSSEMLTFTQAESTEEADPYEEMMASAQQTRAQNSDFRFSARIKASPELRAFIDIGEENSLNASGSGTIILETSAQGFSLGGDYAIQDGSFHFSALNLVSRNFTIQDGSTVRFNGDVWDTDLDVMGLYVTKASLSNLLPSYNESEAGGNSRRTVNCGIHISGKIKNPEVDFSIDVPDLNPIMQAQVESALNTEDKVQKQFVYLLVAGNFLPTEESGITTNGSDVLFSNVSSIMSGQINNIFQKLDIPLDLGLNYQTTQAGKDLFDVAVSTQLFNNRVIVNGTVGNKQLAGGATTNEIAGDIDIEIKLNRSGTFRLSLFSHSADQYTYYLDNSQRNGGGIAYQREFNTFGQFFRELFSSREKREQMALEAAIHPVQSVVLEIDENGKSTSSHEQR